MMPMMLRLTRPTVFRETPEARAIRLMRKARARPRDFTARNVYDLMKVTGYQEGFAFLHAAGVRLTLEILP